MRVSTLHARLTKLIEQGHGAKPVCIDKSSFTDNREPDGCVVLPVAAATGPRWIANSDDDGGIKTNSDGSESGRMTIVLVGDSAILGQAQQERQG